MSASAECVAGDLVGMDHGRGAAVDCLGLPRSEVACQKDLMQMTLGGVAR